MNAPDETPRCTPVTHDRLPPVKPGFNAGAFFAHKDRLARLCSTVTLMAVIVAGLALAFAIPNARQRVLFVVLDPAGNCIVAPGVAFHQARELHVQQAMLATTALLLRNPKDFDQPELVQAIFSRPAQAQALALKTAEASEFQARQVRQKPEIARIEAITTRQEEVQVQVTGQLIRNGVVEDAPFTDVVRFTLKLVLVPNPDLLRNARQPTVVTDFALHYEAPRS